MGDRDHVGSTEHVALWDAIDAVVVASGGKANTSVARMRAVVRVEDSLRRLMATKPDPRDARIAELERLLKEAEEACLEAQRERERDRLADKYEPVELPRKFS